MKRYFAPFFSAVIAALLIVVFGLFYFFIFKEIPGVGYIGYIFIAIAIFVKILICLPDDAMSKGFPS